MNPSTGIMIGSMRLRGDTRHKNALLQSLDSQHWAGEDDEKIIFIKKIHVQGQWWELGQKLAQTANALVDNASQYPQVDGEQNTVAFNNRPQLVAHLITNLLEGKTSWYQQSWLQQSAIAPDPVSLLVHQLFDIPDVLGLLEKNKKLEQFFNQCSPEGFNRIVQALLPLSPLAGEKLHNLLATGSEPLLTSPNGVAKLSTAQQQWIAGYLSACLQKKSVNESLSKSLNKILLIISLLSLWRFNPQQLRSVEWVTQQFNSVHAIYQQTFAKVVGDTDRASPQENKRVTATREPADLSRQDLAFANAIDVQAELVQEQSDELQADQLLLNDVIEQPVYRLISHGGFFFLLNYLRHSNLTQTIPADMSPWAWFAQLVRKLSNSVALPMDENLQALLQDISQLPADEFNAMAAVQDDLLYQPALEFLQRKLTALDLWSAQWLCMTARVHVDQAYVHLYMDQSAVRIDVRMAGLDINPGWVPWLGRVIYFHYGSYPELI